MMNQSDIKIYWATVTGTLVAVQLGAIAEVWASADGDYSFLIDSDWHSCQQISSDYQEVYAFETDSFYINICQKDNLYFYAGEAKQRDDSSIFIPAVPLDNNRGFRAINGNVSYVAILPFQNHSEEPLKPNEAILTIKRNGRLIKVESSLNKYCHQPEAIAFDNMKLNSQSLDRLATIPQQQDIGSSLLSERVVINLSKEIFHADSHFDFYRLDGKIHRLATCS